MSEIVVPDSIDPYIGFKALTLTEGACESSPGHVMSTLYLVSPQQRMLWPHGQKAEAYHRSKGTVWVWRQVEEKTEEEELLKPVDALIKRQNFVWSSRTHTWMVMPDKPKEAPETGYKWAFVEVPHEIAGSGCQCGIYAVRSISSCLSYLQPDAVLVRVALWGRTTKAVSGARGQFAYPQEIIGYSCSRERAEEVATLYGIAITDKESQFHKEYTRLTGYTNSATLRLSAAKASASQPFVHKQMIEAAEKASASFQAGRRRTVSPRRDLRVLAIWACSMSAGMIGLNLFLGKSPVWVIWWLVHIVAWGLYLASTTTERKEKRQ